MIKISCEKTASKIRKLEQIYTEQINNPKINKNDTYYNDRMVLLVRQKSNWHLYYDPKHVYIYSIAVVPGAKSSHFGSVTYFKRWYNWKKRNHKDTMLCLTDKAIDLLDL